jgi:hypothetical protein
MPWDGFCCPNPTSRLDIKAGRAIKMRNRYGMVPRFLWAYFIVLSEKLTAIRTLGLGHFGRLGRLLAKGRARLYDALAS